MKKPLPLASLLVLVIGLAPTLAFPSDPVVSYRLGDEAAMQTGCLAPCECPVLIQSPLAGTFRLVPDGFDGVFHHYQVLDIDWQFKSVTAAGRATGSGTYRVAGDQQQLAVDLSIDGQPAQRYDSGLTAGGSSFPQLRLPIALNGFYCHDTVFGVEAIPAMSGVATGGAGRLSLRLGPNPFRGSAEVVFSLPKDGPVDLRIHDLAGREIKAIAAGRFTAGPHTMRWDGRDVRGAEAPAGIYFMRLKSAGRELRTSVVKLD